ncbi:ubiquitin-conjugating enzyme E2 J1-like [Leguminivora glycinivorella]|uniref:ubiquitin-conjugating enzyme E2 J1-like n=1 Tax=Leguminivora glycinivorella TaxID=1035111 RepID=UPI00200C2F02|nr:ubiquitin-conjugating enzyme E2 J1-like [Leguminivora glycinivorella]
MTEMGEKYNIKCPGVKRLMKEALELAEATEEYCARPLEDNLFEWHFTVQGPKGTDFEGGIYHGRILLPKEYPMHPPHIILLTPNGRFEVNKKICLSISGHHPETWQPSWSIRTALLALIAFMPTPAEGTIGSLDYTPAERKILAKKSSSWSCPQCGEIAKLLSSTAAKPLTEEEQSVLNQIAFKGEDEQTQKAPEPETAPEPEVQALESTEPSTSFLDQLTEILVALLVGAIGIFIYRRWKAFESVGETEL